MLRNVILSLVVAACATVAGESANAAEAGGPELSASSLAQSVLPRARRAGDVASLEVMRSTLGVAQTALDPLAVPKSTYVPPGVNPRGVPSEETPVDVVVMRGHFYNLNVPTPRGVPGPTGTVLAFTVNSHTGYVLELYLGNRSPGPGLGPPVLRMTIPDPNRALLIVTVLTSGGPRGSKPQQLGDGVIQVSRNGKVIASARSGRLMRYLKPAVYRVSGSSARVMQGRTCEVKSVRLHRGHTTRLNVYCSIK